MKYVPFCLIISSLLITTTSSTEVGKQDTPRVLSFTFEALDPRELQWKSSTDVEKGSHIRLTCTIDRLLSQTFHIRRQNETINVLTPLQRPNGRQVVHEIANLDCDHLGIYVCEDEKGAHATVELGIFNCEPRFCDPETDSKITTTAVPEESRTFLVCVFAYPDINVVKFTSDLDLAKRSVQNGMESVGDNTTPIEAKEVGASDTTWSYELEQDPDNFGVFRVNITKTRVSKDDYGEHTFAIFTVHREERKQLKYTVLLKPPDPPDCPTYLAVTSRSFHEVKLIWQPGLGRGVQQLFYIFFSSDNQTWHKYDKYTSDNSITVTGLKEDNQYAFRIVPGNKFLENIDQNRCQYTVYDKTEGLPPCPCTDDSATNSTSRDQETNPSSDDGVPVWAVVLIALKFVVGIVVIVFLLLVLKRGNLLWTQRDETHLPVPAPGHTDMNEANLDILIPRENYSQEHIYEEAE